MVLAAPEFVVAEPVKLLDEVEIAAKLQKRMLADRVVRGEKGAKIQTRHDGYSRCLVCIDPDRAGPVNRRDVLRLHIHTTRQLKNSRAPVLDSRRLMAKRRRQQDPEHGARTFAAT
jgi:hypothetical protein